MSQLYRHYWSKLDPSGIVALKHHRLGQEWACTSRWEGFLKGLEGNPDHVCKACFCQRHSGTDFQSERGIIPVIQGIEGADAVGGLDIGVEVEGEAAFLLAIEHVGEAGAGADPSERADVVRTAVDQVTGGTSQPAPPLQGMVEQESRLGMVRNQGGFVIVVEVLVACQPVVDGDGCAAEALDKVRMYATPGWFRLGMIKFIGQAQIEYIKMGEINTYLVLLLSE
jgi:hypothetical protein